MKTHPPRADPPKNPLLPLAKLFWWAGGLFGLLLGGCMLLLSGEIYLLLLFLCPHAKKPSPFPTRAFAK